MKTLQNNTIDQLEELRIMFPYSEVIAINDFNFKIDGATFQENEENDYEAQFEDVILTDGTILIKQ